LLTDSLASI